MNCSCTTSLEFNLNYTISTVIRQKCESQNVCFRKTKHARFSEKRTFLTPDTHRYVCVSGGKRRPFFEKFDDITAFFLIAFSIHMFDQPRCTFLRYFYLLKTQKIIIPFCCFLCLFPLGQLTLQMLNWLIQRDKEIKTAIHPKYFSKNLIIG